MPISLSPNQQLTNSEKNQHGKATKNALGEILKNCKSDGYIMDIECNYRVGRPGYNANQFYVPFLITLVNQEKWALFSTTSLRNDRIKEQQWDAINIKEINPQIKKAFLVYPDGLPERIKNDFESKSYKYSSGYEYSAIDVIVSQSAISTLIENASLPSLNTGQFTAQRGNSFERRIANILNYYDNFQKWKTNAPTLEGMHYDVFCQIVTKLNITPEKTVSIKATSDKRVIGRLPSGGNPKTDVLVSVQLANGGIDQIFTISCKRTSNKKVSVHQYTADSFADVLNKNDSKLRRLLIEFQKNGNLRDFGTDNTNALKDALSAYQEKLCRWVLGGFGGEGNDRQCANYILTYNNSTDKISVYETQEYYRSLISAGITGHFGTIFDWTYSSGHKGQSIQLKMPVL